MKRLLSDSAFKSLAILCIIFAVAVFALPLHADAARTRDQLQSILEVNYPDGLPRYTTPEEQQWIDEQKSLGFSFDMLDATAPPSGATWTPPEYYQPLGGILVRWTTGSSYVVLPVMVAEASEVTTVWCFVENASEQTAATTAFTNAGANMGNIQFITYNSDSIWIRDYGPRYVYENSQHAIIDHTYNRAARPNDDALPVFLSSYWSDPLFDIGLTHGGGNFHAFSNGDAFMSSLIINENPGFTEADIKQIFRDYFNVNLTIYPRLISNVDTTGHIDMWFMPLSDNKVLISQFPSSHTQSKATTDAAAADLAARGYTVYRTPARNTTGEGSSGGTHYTYTNSVIVNNKVIIPRYGGSEATNDATALAVYQSALPGYEIVQVDCSAIISLSGAVHCIMKHVYPATTPIPMIEVTSANGDEWWRQGTQQQIQWVASDDLSVASIDLYYSINNGSNWIPIATGLSNTGSYDWTVPAVESDDCLVRAVVFDASANSRQDVSDAVFTISADAPPPEPPVSGSVTTNTSSSSRSSATISHTVPAGEDRLLAVNVMIRGDRSVSAVTYAGNPLSQAIRRASGASNGCTVEIWYLVSPPIGTANVVVTFASSVDPSAITAVNFTGVNQSSPIGATAGTLAASGTGISTNITTLNDYSLIFGAATSYGGDTDPYAPGSGVSELWDIATGTSTSSDNAAWGGDREAITAGSYTFNAISNASDDWAIAAVEIKSEPPCISPSAASNPNPSDSAVNISTSADLSWTTGSGAVSHDVYFGTVNPPPFQINQASVSFDPGTMAANTTYYWRIDEVNPCGTTLGTIWSFTTKAIVPDVTGQTQSAASSAIITAGLIVGSVTEQHSDTVLAGSVINQNPAAGAEIDTGSAVDIVVSLGLPIVPDVTGQSQAYAESQIIAASFTVGTVSTAHSDTVPAGSVISQSPIGGTPATSGTAIDMVISLGLPLIPDVTNQTQSAAEAAIVAANFTVGAITTSYSDIVPAGNVITQLPIGGTPAISGTAIDMVISLGLPLIPDVTNQTQPAAEAAIVAANFTVGEIITSYSDTVPAGNVITQSPIGGTPATSGTAIDMVISLGLPLIPDVTNQTQSAAEAAIIAANFTVGNITTSYSDTVPAGSVISQSPIGGTPAVSGTAIDMVISSGPAPRIISGYITEPDANIPVAGVSLQADNGGGSDITDANGYYELQVAYDWSGTVSLQKTGYTFDPAATLYENITENQIDSYVAVLDTFIISGYVFDAALTPLADVLMTPDNDGGPYTSKYYGGGSGLTDANGYYEIEVDYNWSGSVTPAKYAYAFQPAGIAYTDVIADILETQNYTANLLTYKISGCIKNACLVPIAGVTVQATAGGSSAVTDETGYYEIWVDYNWSGTITAGDKQNYAFNPAEKIYTAVLADIAEQDYSAFNKYDLDCSGRIDFGDVAEIALSWLESGPDISADFIDDDVINLRDFADFAETWQQE